jgi:hypothetical protein
MPSGKSLKTNARNGWGTGCSGLPTQTPDRPPKESLFSGILWPISPIPSESCWRTTPAYANPRGGDARPPQPYGPPRPK